MMCLKVAPRKHRDDEQKSGPIIDVDQGNLGLVSAMHQTSTPLISRIRSARISSLLRRFFGWIPQIPSQEFSVPAFPFGLVFFCGILSREGLHIQIRGSPIELNHLST